MKRYVFLLSSLLLVAACPGLHAQQTLIGWVVDHDAQPISYVTVQSGDIAQAVQTDEVGEFKVIANHPGPITLTFSHAGYIPRSVRIDPADSPVNIRLTRQVHPMQGITVTAGQAVRGQSPVAFETIEADVIERDFDIGEVPGFLEITPNLYSYSDAGGGLGYSYLKIRGFDARRAPVYINGVPLNDPEDHALYFVDLPDFVSNADNIQVQRGVGNSLYGDAAFGGSINILTSALVDSRKFTLEYGYGGYLQGSETIGLMRKSSIAYSSGLIDGVWSISGRWVKQFSDGYRYNSWYDGNAYYLSVGRIDPRMITTLDIYGGPIRTHAAWDGIDRETMHVDRRTNWYTYDDETDNFNQPHFELHNIYNLRDHVTLNSTAYLIKGKGYYEQFRYGESLLEYNLTDDPDLSSNLTRRKWVDKYQLGLNSHITIDGDRHSTSFGGSYYFFESEHWGEVLWSEALSPSLLNADDPPKYYEYFGTYHNASVFGSRSQTIGERLTLTANLQLRYLHKDIHLTPMGLYEPMIYGIDWLFVSPRIGINYALTDNLTPFFGFSIASHEPNDDMIDDADDPTDIPRLETIDDSVTPIIYGDPTVDAERVYDFELGVDYKATDLSFNANLFWMEYLNEIVPDGGINDDGCPTMGNADRSVHRGIELAAGYSPFKSFKIETNYAFNDNLIKEYDQYISNGGGIDTISHRDVPVPQFPTYLANLTLDYTYGPTRLVYRLRAVGRQFVSLDGRYADVGGVLEDVSIAPYTVSSIKAIVDLSGLLGAGLVVEGRVDNLLDHTYETHGYRWGDYFAYWPAAERNWFVTFKMAI